MFEYGSDPEWAAFASRPYTRSDAERVVAKAVLTSWSKKPIFAAALSGRVVGVAELEVNSIGTEAELAYDIARPHWGRGLAVEAATEVVDWGFREFGLVKVAAYTNIRNRQSWRVMEKLGMTREGVFRHSRWHRGELSDSVAYAVLRDEWCGPHGPLPPTPTPVEEEDSTDRTWRELRTPRLLLRPFRPGDVDEVFNYSNDPEWAEHLIASVPQPYTRRHAEELIARRIVESSEAQPCWAIALDGTCIGSIRLTTDPSHAAGELHYALARTHWGRGFMPEAAGAVVDWAFRQRGLAKISARTYTPNTRSSRVMEKLGMSREGVVRSHHEDPRPDHPRIDFVHYGLLREEWEKAP